MLYLLNPITPSTQDEIQKACCKAIEVLDKHPSNYKDVVSMYFNLSVFASWKPEAFREVIQELMNANVDDTVTYLTDWHFLVLFCLLERNMPEGQFKETVDEIFFDTDFLIPAETFNKMLPEVKKACQFSDAVFSIINGLAPHPDEVKLKVTDPKTRVTGNQLPL